MMNPGDIYLGIYQQEIPLPATARKVTPQIVEITRTNRTVSGSLVEDIIRVYTNYQIDYENMIGADRDILLNLYGLNKHLHLLYMRQDGSIDYRLVKMTMTDGRREFIGKEWLWSGVSIFLEVI